jgi:SAM-dependent methyltransferase
MVVMKSLFKRETVVPTMPAECHGFVDTIAPTVIAGWADDRAHPVRPVFVDITINNDVVARVRASIFRRDLEALGYGDGRKGFYFNPVQYLKRGENKVRVSFTGTPETLPNGYQTIHHHAAIAELQVDSQFNLRELSQARWKGDEEDASLTWDQIMTGESFLELVLHHYAFTGKESILEIGPGYGRLLDTILERRLPFNNYVGMELSPARVERLTRKFKLSSATFTTGDILNDVWDVRADLILSSATFDLLYPSMQEALDNLHNMSRAGTRLFIDFTVYPGDHDMHMTLAYFESKPTFIRVYSRAEIEEMFAQAGFRVLAFEKATIGKDRFGAEVRRALVVAIREA